MNKIIKRIIIGITILIAAFGIFIGIDYNRLKNSKIYTKPIITIGEEEFETTSRFGIIYYGLGYSVMYYDIGNKSITSGYGTKIFLFNSIQIWLDEVQ